MNAKQARSIGRTVSDLLLYAEHEGLKPTTSGVDVTEGPSGDQHVTLYACRPNGNDYHVRVSVAANGILLPTGLNRWWDAEAESMTDWFAFDALQIAHMDELYR